MSARPFLKWTGGKSGLLPDLLARVPDSYGTYHEPFVGGGALFFALSPRNGAVLSDANLRLVRTYKAIRDNVDDVIAELKPKVYQREVFEAERARDIDVCSDVDVAAWMIYLSKTCFNGLYRVNRAGKFNVSFGRYENPKICDEENLRACAHALADVDIKHEDFRQVVGHVNPNDFVYFDSPYVPLSDTSNFTSYTAGGFGPSDQKDLRNIAASLKRRGVHVLLSNSWTPAIEELYKDFTIDRVKARRAINSKATGRGAIDEALIR